MRYSITNTTGLMLAAITIGEVVAGPTHAHMHKHMRNKKDVDWSALDWNAMGIDWSSAWAAGQETTTAPAAATAAPVVENKPAATTAAAVSDSPAVAIQVNAAAKASTTTPAAAAQTAASITTEIESDISSLFNNLVGASNSLTSFGKATSAKGSVGDFYVGNTGGPYGSNIIKASSGASYPFTNTFVNSQKKGITVNIWQKVGPDMQPLSGSALAPQKTTLTFYLAPGAEQTVAFQENTQVGWAEACKQTAASGAYATTWGEANFVTTGSGYDVSAIMNPNNNNYDMTITSTQAPACTSSRTENFWLTDSQPIGNSDGSCFIAQNTATLRTVMGGTI